MPVYGPTGGDFARDTARYLNKGVAGLGAIGTGLIQRSVMREKKRQADVQNLYKTFTDLVNSENYDGDVTAAAEANTDLVEELTLKLFPDDPSTAKLISDGIINGNHSAQQYMQLAENKLVKEAYEDQVEAVQQSKAMKDISDQGRPTNSLAGLAMDYQSQQDQAAQPQVDMKSMFGGAPAATTRDGGGAPESRVDRTPQGAGGVATPREQALSLLRERTADLAQRAGSSRGAFANQKLQVLTQLKEDPKVPDEVKAELDNAFNMLGSAGSTEPAVAITLEPVKAKQGSDSATQDVTMQHRADAGKYQEVYAQTDSHYETSRQVIGFNENDIHDAVNELDREGTVKNKQVKGFLDEHNLPETAEGVAQALTYMNTAILSQENDQYVPLPKTTTNYGGLGEAAMGRYEKLTSMLTGRETPAVPTPPPTEETTPPPSEQLVNGIQESEGKTYSLENETADGWMLKDENGKGRFVTKEQALRAGFIKLSPTVEKNRTTYDLSANQALTIDKYISNPSGLSNKENKLLQSTFAKIGKTANADLNKEQNKKALRDVGGNATQEVKRQNYSRLAISLIDSMPGDTFEDRRKALIATSAPKNVQDERRFQEIIRQFGLNYDLDLRRLELEEGLAILDYTASRGMQEAIEGLSLSERNSAAFSLMEKIYPTMIDKLWEKSDGNIKKFIENKDELLAGEPGFESANTAYIKAISEIWGTPFDKTYAKVYNDTLFPDRVRGLINRKYKDLLVAPVYSVRGGDTATPEGQDNSYEVSPETRAFFQAARDDLNKTGNP